MQVWVPEGAESFQDAPGVVCLYASHLCISTTRQSLPDNQFLVQISQGKSDAKGQSMLRSRVRGYKARLMQGAQLAEDPSSDREAHDARLSADMAARVAAVSAISQLAQVASQPQRQLNDSTSAPSDMQHAGMLLQPDYLDAEGAF